ncbi:MAG: hypothetical protein ACI8UO_005945 [Verrucomicrobiales bacterium]|jgi:hypothetical protein
MIRSKQVGLVSLFSVIFALGTAQAGKNVFVQPGTIAVGTPGVVKVTLPSSSKAYQVKCNFFGVDQVAKAIAYIGKLLPEEEATKFRATVTLLIDQIGKGPGSVLKMSAKGANGANFGAEVTPGNTTFGDGRKIMVPAGTSEITINLRISEGFGGIYYIVVEEQ